MPIDLIEAELAATPDPEWGDILAHLLAEMDADQSADN